MQHGKVKWFDAEKGFGFIEPSDGSQDVFVHRSNVAALDFEEALREGEEVEFEVERTPKGLSALNVERVGSDHAL
jgi:CspA family cold shock protein